jgi:hypothetical protein
LRGNIPLSISEENARTDRLIDGGQSHRDLISSFQEFIARRVLVFAIADKRERLSRVALSLHARGTTQPLRVFATGSRLFACNRKDQI